MVEEQASLANYECRHEIRISFLFPLAIAFDGACKDNERSPAAEALVYQAKSPKRAEKGKRRKGRAS